MNKQKLTITIDPRLFHEIDLHAKSKQISRSQFVERILATWQQADTRSQLIEGYKAMATENAAIAKQFEPLGNEVWSHE